MRITNHKLFGIPFVSTNKFYDKNDVRFIVMHYTAGYTAQSAINILARNKKAKVSAHLVIDREGQITQLVPFNKGAWHAGPSEAEGYTGLNKYSIGIELVNIGYLKPYSGGYLDAYGDNVPVHQFPQYIEENNYRVGSQLYKWPTYTDAQLSRLDKVVESLLEEYPNIIKIVGHEEIDTRGWKTDPGPAFPMKRYTNMLQDRSMLHDSDQNQDSNQSTLIENMEKEYPNSVQSMEKEYPNIAQIIKQDSNYGRSPLADLKFIPSNDETLKYIQKDFPMPNIKPVSFPEFTVKKPKPNTRIDMPQPNDIKDEGFLSDTGYLPLVMNVTQASLLNVPSWEHATKLREVPTGQNLEGIGRSGKFILVRYWEKGIKNEGWVFSANVGLRY